MVFAVLFAPPWLLVVFSERGRFDRCVILFPKQLSIPAMARCGCFTSLTVALTLAVDRSSCLLLQFEEESSDGSLRVERSPLRGDADMHAMPFSREDDGSLDAT